MGYGNRSVNLPLHRSVWYLALLSALLFAPATRSNAQELVGEGVWRRPIMSGDRLNISVEESPDISRVYPVTSDGTVDFSLLGRVQVAELTLPEAEERIEKMLEDTYFKKATVKIAVAEFVEGNVLVQGEVAKPGELPMTQDTVLTLMEAIARCGGLTTRAGADQVRILRWKPSEGLQRQIIVVDVRNMFNKLDFSKDMFLRPRDMVIVPGLGESDSAGEFLALGDVAAPGFHPVHEGLDVIRAVTAIGGLSRNAKLDAARLLRPDGKGNYTVIPLDLYRLFGNADVTVNRKVLKGDILFVPSADQASAGRIYLLGAVERKGAYPLPIERDATLAKVILSAGGISNFGDGTKVKILRTAPDGSKQSLTVNVDKILKTGAFEDDMQLRNDDVIIVPERILLL